MAINLVGGLQETFNRRHGTQTDQFSTLEDFSDRLNRFYTTAIILILAGVTITTVYFLKPISCTLPHAPSSGFTSYAESVCWVQGTIGLDKTDKIPGNEAEWIKLRAKSDMSFYQWVPFCLAIQAILFFIPYLIWQALSVNTLGENFNYLITRAKSASMTNDSESRSRLVKACANQLNLLTLQHADKRQSGWARFQRAIVTHIPGSRFFLLNTVSDQNSGTGKAGPTLHRHLHASCEYAECEDLPIPLDLDTGSSPFVGPFNQYLESSASNVDNLRQSPQFPGFIFRKEEAQRFYEEIVGLNGTFLIRMLRLNAGDVITGEILVAWWEICKRSRRIVEVQEKWV
ncbi:hypothetical protein Aperf_G00000035710 [Anoplocephala perfoliata]